MPEDLDHCSFCGKARKDVDVLVAGLHAAVCDECAPKLARGEIGTIVEPEDEIA